MALETGGFTTYLAIGNREDLSDIIYNIAPTDTPFLSMAAKTKATAVNHEWQTDTLAAASAANAVLEGDAATVDAATATVRLGNICQISDKVPRVTGTQRAVVSAGRKDEMPYQIAKRGKELKRDMESSITANNAKVAGDATTARELAGAPAWMVTNTNKGGGAAADPTGDGTDARTDGDTRVLTESQLADVLKQCWDEGGEPDCVMLGSFNKQKASGFTGNSTRFDKGEDKKLTAAIDVYVSDFGEVKLIPNRFMRARDALVLQKDMWAVASLRGIERVDLAKTGDTDRVQIITEYTLESRNEKASGIIADLTVA